MLLPVALLVAAWAQNAVTQGTVNQSTVGDQCYSHDGISAADSPISANTTAKLLFKCNENTPFTTCCVRGTETCGNDLLCHNVNGYLVARQYCTDPTWTTDQCSALCPQFHEAGTVLTTCDDGSYCCGSRADDCCDAGRGYQVNPNNGQIVIKSATQSTTSTSSSSTSSTSAPATTSSTATAATAGAAQTGSNGALPSQIPPSSGLSGGAKAGIAIGAVAGVAIIAGLAFLLFRERRKRKALAESEKQPLGYGNGYGYGNMGSSNMHQQQQQPMAPPTELGAGERNEHKYHYHSELGDGQGRPSELHP